MDAAVGIRRQRAGVSTRSASRRTTPRVFRAGSGWRLWCVCWIALVLGCQGASLDAGDPSQRNGLDGNARLGRAVVPQRYSLELDLDPTKDELAGRVEIEVEVAQASDLIRLHGGDLRIESVDVRSAAGAHEVHWVAGRNGGLGLGVEPPLPSGPATLRFVYTAPLPEAPMGIYRVRVGDDWYVFSQFQPLEARRAFPSFDQPEFKTPYRVTLRVPHGMLALSNGPEIERRVDGEAEVFSFAETEPLPSYLVAFAVGDFVVAESPDGANGRPPIRVVAVKGKQDLSAYALDWAPRILDWLAGYFGRPYPFAKLDLVGVPNFSAGAMENAGLVTFRESLLLLDAEQTPVQEQIASLNVIAHELAHMWFGDLVTPAWWDELWLNESFASWMASKATAELAPEFETSLQSVSHTQYVMYLDSQRDARPIRRPIRDGGDVYNAFDGITYGKGEAVLRMVEGWIGDTAFRAGVRQYIDEHAYGSGRTTDLFAALAAASGKQVGDTIAPFLDQPGTPMLDVSVRCGGAGAVFSWKQSRYSPGGIDLPSGEPWDVPACVAFGRSPGQRVRECFVASGHLGGRRIADSCPEWLYPNADELGYYRWRTSEAELLALLRDHLRDLSIREQVAFSGILAALLESRDLSLAGYLDATRALSELSHWKVIAGVASSLRRLERTAVAADVAEEYAAFVRRFLGPALDRIGFEAKADEAVGDRLLRAPLIGTLGGVGRDVLVRDHAARAVRSLIADPAALSVEQASLLLPIAAWDGDERLWRALVSTLGSDPSPALRVVLIRALGSFEDPRLLQRSLDLVLSGALRGQDYGSLVASVRPAASDAAWEWFVANYDELVERVGRFAAPSLPSIGRNFCSREDARRVERFFAASSHAPEGTEHQLALVLEDVERCARLVDAASADLRSYLMNEARGAR